MIIWVLRILKKGYNSGTLGAGLTQIMSCTSTYHRNHV